jgi:hypothetical protein
MYGSSNVEMEFLNECDTPKRLAVAVLAGPEIVEHDAHADGAQGAQGRARKRPGYGRPFCFTPAR